MGENLQYLKNMHKNMTQEDLASVLNVSRQTISKWEMNICYPEMDKAIELSKYFSCTLDELLKGDVTCFNEAYKNITVKHLDKCLYYSHTVISKMPEDDANKNVFELAKRLQIENPIVIGWDFPFISSEQTNVFHMHGYTSALVVSRDYQISDYELKVLEEGNYAVITIEEPFKNAFVLIPNAYKNLIRYMDVNGLNYKIESKETGCFEKVYQKGKAFMDVYIKYE